MKTPFEHVLDLNHLDPDLKSYILQTITEFEPFTTPETMVAVVAKDPLKLKKQYLENGQDWDAKKMKKLHRVSIALFEDKAKVEEEALGEDLYQAIRGAKEKLLIKLGAIHDQVISSSERDSQIQSVLANTQLH